MGSRGRSAAVVVRTLEGKTKAYGLIRRVTAAGADIATDVQLGVGDTLQFRFFDPGPPDMTERFGRVLWNDLPTDPAGNLASECRVKWLSGGEVSQPGTVRPETGRHA